MKWNEKIQYKAKSYLYEKEHMKERVKEKKTSKEDGFFGSLLGTLDEMDSYIEEIVDQYLPRKDKK